jgi:hypothetical protein
MTNSPKRRLSQEQRRARQCPLDEIDPRQWWREARAYERLLVEGQ